MKAQPSSDMPWGYPRDEILFVYGVEIVIPKGSYPTCEAICQAINERCGREVAFPGIPIEDMWIIDFDEFELAALKLMREAAGRHAE